jgi:hypothetical protein
MTREKRDEQGAKMQQTSGNLTDSVTGLLTACDCFDIVVAVGGSQLAVVLILVASNA